MRGKDSYWRRTRTQRPMAFGFTSLRPPSIEWRSQKLTANHVLLCDRSPVVCGPSGECANGAKLMLLNVARKTLADVAPACMVSDARIDALCSVSKSIEAIEAEMPSDIPASGRVPTASSRTEISLDGGDEVDRIRVGEVLRLDQPSPTKMNVVPRHKRCRNCVERYFQHSGTVRLS